MIGCTPGEWGDEETFDTRGQEIQRWLEKNAVEPYQFVVIDDFTIEKNEYRAYNHVGCRFCQIVFTHCVNFQGVRIR